jgi:L-amino acid N-acyltransferase YncA
MTLTRTILPASSADAEAICAIYNHYVLETSVSFEEAPVSTEEMAGRIADVAAAGLPWLVLVEEGTVVGYAYATKWRARPAYRYSVESSVYLDVRHTGRGLGRSLYDALLAQLRERELHLVIAGIALPNEASVGLHERLGYRKAAHFNEIGLKFGRWADVGYWQLQINT